MKTERIIEAVVALVIGLTVLFTAIFTDGGVSCIVLGALVTAVGVGCLVWALVDGTTKTAKKAQPAKKTSSTVGTKAPVKRVTTTTRAK